jgi:hypothetical protein
VSGDMNVECFAIEPRFLLGAGEIGEPHMFAHLPLDEWKKDLVDGVKVFNLAAVGWLNLDHLWEAKWGHYEI